jgi:hypothetical protein
VAARMVEPLNSCDQARCLATYRYLSPPYIPGKCPQASLLLTCHAWSQACWLVSMDLAAYIKQSAAASGVPARVSDSQTLFEIARLLVAARAHHANLPLSANQHRQVG